ncbi:MAG TPA: hypothetical protein VJ846_01230 [Sphingomicrobium sp.]|nr:hypothetical protein [Sphingomicrobium sp.]
MGGISEASVEWAVVNRLKAMLDDPPKTDFNVTLGFSLFSTILLWTKNRMWIRDAAILADEQALAARGSSAELRLLINPGACPVPFLRDKATAKSTQALLKWPHGTSSNGYATRSPMVMAGRYGRSIGPQMRPARNGWAVFGSNSAGPMATPKY